MSRPIQPGIRSAGGAPDPAEAARARFREAMARWPAAVALLAVQDEDGDLETLTVSAVTSVSADPPLLLVSLGLHAGILTMLQEVGRFTVNLLAEEDRRLATDAANRMPPPRARFPHRGDPVLPGAPAALVCRVWAQYPGGDHTLVVGQVERVELGPEAPPLLYAGRDYRGLRPGRVP